MAIIEEIAERLAASNERAALRIAVVTAIGGPGGKTRTDVTGQSWIPALLSVTGLAADQRVVVLHQGAVAVIVGRLT